MRLALFGGTFDPIHSGHLSAARAAQAAYALDRVMFVPTGIPPHKREQPLAPFEHRCAMITLACAGSPGLGCSLLESPQATSSDTTCAIGYTPNYTIDTVRRMREQLFDGDHLFFLIGADAFLDLANWREPVALLDSCDFIVVSRPGFDLEKIHSVLPPEVRAGPVAADCIPLRSSAIHLLTSVEADISSSEIRQRAAQGESLEGLVPPAVARYIRGWKLYKQLEPADETKR